MKGKLQLGQDQGGARHFVEIENKKIPITAGMIITLIDSDRKNHHGRYEADWIKNGQVLEKAKIIKIDGSEIYLRENDNIWIDM